ncbi:hypothetical protein ACFR9U_10705 [Halorientalis brevis]|uniref:Uncharacterized protein n=1 Tax=Halorientalis brevis TaxID=1126241 RepID=A0ABD6CAR5_9EURY|nr:hypothetical protein [Halorientalis brevis]
MSPSHARKLVSIPVRALAAVLATIGAVLAVWHSGQFALQAVGSPTSSTETRTLLGVGAGVVGSLFVPGYVTVRNYVHTDSDE